eukprot:8480836-Lingulodinium_polyedra.AAC.1
MSSAQMVARPLPVLTRTARIQTWSGCTTNAKSVPENGQPCRIPLRITHKNRKLPLMLLNVMFRE